MKIVLHSYWRSSASHRVRIGLGLKELAYDYVAVNILDGGQSTEGYLAKNPMAQVPTLELTADDGARLTLTQSLPILEYLDERWPEHPLLPRDPVLRAKTRALAEIVNAGIQPLQNLIVMRRVKQLGGDELAWVQPFIAAGLTAFAKLAEHTAGAFSVGDAPTLADICLMPQLGAARRYKVELDSTFDRLLAIEARCLALPAFANAVPERQPDAAKTVTP
ncbi:MAG TPA: maleylacetoacetate isomerase [Kofleriaceae bacterium]|jgi:maleylpyruvate isomerase|nr:maleylacetoacetate isomerase [Kofleriaceae bacterium]